MNSHSRIIPVLLYTFVLQLCFAVVESAWSLDVSHPRLEIEVGKSRIINSPTQIRRASLADPRMTIHLKWIGSEGR